MLLPKLRGAWVAQSVKHLTLAQVLISWFVSSRRGSGFVLTAQNLEPALDSVSPFPSRSAPPPTHALSFSLWFLGLSPALGSARTAQSLEPALDSVSPSLSAPPLLMLCLSLSLKNK